MQGPMTFACMTWPHREPLRWGCVMTAGQNCVEPRLPEAHFTESVLGVLNP